VKKMRAVQVMTVLAVALALCVVGARADEGEGEGEGAADAEFAILPGLGQRCMPTPKDDAFARFWRLFRHGDPEGDGPERDERERARRHGRGDDDDDADALKPRKPELPYQPPAKGAAARTYAGNCILSGDACPFPAAKVEGFCAGIGVVCCAAPVAPKPDTRVSADLKPVIRRAHHHHRRRKHDWW